MTDREVDDETLTIQHGRFYNDLDMPDSEVIHAGDLRIQRFAPDYMLIHPSALDMIGHRHGGESSEYNAQAAIVDGMLSQCVPRWLDTGYQVVVTSDHGMNRDGFHGGTSDESTLVPFYWIDGTTGGVDETPASQLSVAPTVLRSMGVDAAPSMRQTPSI